MSTLAKADLVSLPVAVRRFVVHFLEMCVAMCLGGGLLNGAVFGVLALIGYSSFATDAPAASMLIIGIDLALAMAVYMTVRHHPVRHNIEMSGSTVAGAVLFVLALWLGWIPSAIVAGWSTLFALMCGPLCLLMFVVMAVRFDHYGGHVGGSDGQRATAAVGDFTCSMHPEVRRQEPGKCPLCGMALVRRS